MTHTHNDAYHTLYRVGGAAALVAAIFFRRNLDAEFMMLRLAGVFKEGPTVAPAQMSEWFALLQAHPWIGVTFLNAFDLVNYALVGLMLLGLWAALRRSSESWMVLALAIGLVGVGTYLASNQAFTLLALSKEYASASTPEQQKALLAAGQAVLAIHRNDSYAGGIYFSLMLVSVAELIAAAVMLRAEGFGRAIGIVGLLANGIGLGYYPLGVLAPQLVALPVSLSAVFLLAWYVMVGVRLWKMGENSVCLRQRKEGGGLLG